MNKSEIRNPKSEIKRLSLESLAQNALDEAISLGASYADVRLIESTSRNLATKNGVPTSLDIEESQGLGIRLLYHGAWGFAATHDLSNENVLRTAFKAIKIAKASALTKKEPVRLAEEKPIQTEWSSPFSIDPFSVPIEEQLNFLLQIDEEIRKTKGISISETSMHFHKEHKLFLSSEGSRILQHFITSGAGFVAMAFRDGELQKRSYPNSFGGQYQKKGYELIQELELLKNVPRIAEETVRLLDAPSCPVGEKDLILDSSQLGLQIHESVGHPIELDRVLGSEANYAGKSFLTLDQLKTLQYGSPIVHVVADARLSHGPGLGTFGYDDEGVPAQGTDIIREGQFVGYLSSRETAQDIGETRSNGTMRAESWNRIPLIRMTNISLMPKNWDFENLIADTKDGIYLETNRSWSIDDRRLNFQFGTEIGWEIKNGKKMNRVKNPIYWGITPEFWNACDAICSDRYWTLWGTPNCGKGQPCQTMGTGHGSSPARFRGIKVGASH
ncbi:MAG: TldD/PmbA family protein [Chlamydiae bacterium]|nr:TldD/PmbA family protein [Chlamydiota bacterium]MBI3276459.1 TldD/PmbA family protein [Chlamydiota bacterium]